MGGGYIILMPSKRVHKKVNHYATNNPLPVSSRTIPNIKVINHLGYLNK